MRNNYQSGQLVKPGPGRPGYKGFPGVTGGYDTPYNVKNVKSNIDAATKASRVKSLLNKSKGFFKKPVWSERGINYLLNRKIPQWAKGTARTIGGVATGFGSRMPIASLIGSRAAPYYAMWKASEATPVDEKYGITRKENLLAPFYTGERSKENMNKKFLRNREQESNPNNFWRYNPGKYGPREDHPDYDSKKVKWNPWSKDTGAADTPIRYDKDGNIIRYNDAVSHFGMKVLPATGSAEDITGTKEIITETGVPGGGDRDMKYTDPNKAENLAKAAQNKRLKSYLDMMGYDRSKKTALSDALIDASAIVQQGTDEAGSLKEADWGKLINQAIQTTSKRLDKPEQIREAVGLMMTKSAIEKDLSAEENKLAKELTAKRITKLDKELEGNSFAENKVLTAKTTPGQPGFDAAVELTEGKDFKGNLVTSSDWIESLEDMQDDPNSSGLNEKQLIKKYTNKLIEGKGYEDGHYTVGDNLVTIKDSIVIDVE